MRLSAAITSSVQTLLNTQQFEFNQSTVGKNMKVLLEKPAKQPGQFVGRSPYMQSVIVNASPRLLGQIIEAKVTHAGANSVQGEILTDETKLTLSA